MITEDYVNYETAKLLKEKGFYSPYCYYYYFPDIESKTPCITDRVIDVNEDKYLAPTLQMAMKWLRKVHGLFIRVTEDITGNIFEWSIYQKNYGCRMSTYVEDTYEKACEAAIKYCLENLI